MVRRKQINMNKTGIRIAYILITSLLAISFCPGGVNAEEIIPVGEEGLYGEDPDFELDYEVPLRIPKIRLRKAASILPSSYNSYKDGKLPPVRNQRPFGSCWAFSTLGAVEADLIHDGTAAAPDLSELQLAYYSANNYEDPKKCRTDPMKSVSNWLDNGGHMIVASRMLTELIGAIPEESAPYPQSTGFLFSPDQSYLVSKDTVRVNNVYFINNSQRDEVKKAIMEHGAVVASYYDKGSYYNSGTNSYYCSRTGHNHSVMLVGWDDDFTAGNFPTISDPDTISGPDWNISTARGAWLVRNSWGTDGYCREGYFWMSYEDVSLKDTQIVVAIDAVADTYDNCYAYDGYHIGTYPVDLSPSKTAVVTYPVSGGEKLRGIAFEIGTTDVTANVSVRNKSTGEVVSNTVKTTYAGIYTVEFPDELNFPEDTIAEISLSFVPDAGDTTTFICESVVKDHKFGKSYYSGVCDCGFTCVEGDTSEYVDHDPKVRLYTDTVHVEGVKLSSASGKIIKGGTISLTATVIPANAADKRVSWSSSNTGVAKVSSNGVITAVAPGEAVITARSHDGGRTATYKVTVITVAVNGVSLNKTSVSVKAGGTTKLTATVLPENASDKNVTWSTSNKSVATVSSSGKVMALKPGTAVITVTTKDGGKTAKCTVTVKSVKASKITLNKSKATVRTGRKLQLKATISPDNTTDKTVKWTTSKKSVATVNSKGVVKAVGKSGTVKITAVTANGKKATCKITVKPVKVKKVSLKKSKVSVKAGKTVKLKTVISPGDATDKRLIWKSKDKKIAKVSSKGVVKGVKKGKTTITVTTKDGKKTAKCIVTVK